MSTLFPSFVLNPHEVIKNTLQLCVEIIMFVRQLTRVCLAMFIDIACCNINLLLWILFFNIIFESLSIYYKKLFNLIYVCNVCCIDKVYKSLICNDDGCIIWNHVLKLVVVQLGCVITFWIDCCAYSVWVPGRKLAIMFWNTKRENCISKLNYNVCCVHNNNLDGHLAMFVQIHWVI